MTEDFEHGACVDAWLRGRASEQSTSQWIDAFEEAFAAVWGRAHLTLGEVTLLAIVERVIYNASERFPALSSVSVDAAGLRWQALREGADGVKQEELVRELRFALIEVLRVLGSLTADILTPALHAELIKRSRATSELPRNKDGEETK